MFWEGKAKQRHVGMIWEWNHWCALMEATIPSVNSAAASKGCAPGQTPSHNWAYSRANKVSLTIKNEVQLKDDDIASIRTKGIIGDRYVKISRGASKTYIPVGGTLTETESVVDIEDIIGKIVHSLTGDKDEEDRRLPRSC